MVSDSRKERGATLIEVLVATALAVFVLLAVLGAYSQGNALKEHVQGTAVVQNNVRLAMDRVERDLRMIGHGVPTGQRIGQTTLWTPYIFHASPTGIGFRSEIDGGIAEIICTPNSSNTDCPANKLRLDSIAYYEGLNCKIPDTGVGEIKLIAVADDSTWQRYNCNGHSAADGLIRLTTNVPNGTFPAGTSHVATIEQVYLNYAAGTQPPYGSLNRQVRYDWAPSTTFPAGDVTPTPVARQLADFWLEYYDATGTQLTGNPLTSSDLALVRTIVVFMEGYDQVGPDGHPQLIRMRSEIFIRNPES